MEIITKQEEKKVNCKECRFYGVQEAPSWKSDFCKHDNAIIKEIDYKGDTVVDRVLSPKNKNSCRNCLDFEEGEPYYNFTGPKFPRLSIHMVCNDCGGNLSWKGYIYTCKRCGRKGGLEFG